MFGFKLKAMALMFSVVFSGYAGSQVESKSGNILSTQRSSVVQTRHTQQMAAFDDFKDKLTPVQQKIESSLLLKKKVREGNNMVRSMSNGMLASLNSPTSVAEVVDCDIRCQVSDRLVGVIRSLGGTVISRSDRFGYIHAILPLAAIEKLAEDVEVKGIRQVMKPILNRNTLSEGRKAHKVSSAYSTYNVTGDGVKVGVISDSARYLSDLKNTGDLPSSVTVLPGKSGILANGSDTGEGTGMLEIVYDLAPNADLYFADSGTTKAEMAENIIALADAGCKIIVDDITYLDEAPFQDDVTAQAVNEVVARGVIYFSSAANYGNLNAGTSSCWEGDYVCKSTDDNGNGWCTFGGYDNNRIVTFEPMAQNDYGENFGVVILNWSDPIGASSNDYDLYLYDARAGDYIAESTSTQSGTGIPMESVVFTESQFKNGDLRVIVKNYKGNAQPRYLRLNAFGCKLSAGTAGSTFGHNAAENAFSCAAVPAYGLSRAFTSSDVVEDFSSDGPRRVFYSPTGIAYSDDLLSTGGKLLQKPDITAADCTASSWTKVWKGLDYFPGTSAAAPHAAAIAALMLEANPDLKRDDVMEIFKKSTFSGPNATWNRTSGYGILNAEECVRLAVESAKKTPAPTDLSARQNANPLSVTLSWQHPEEDATFYVYKNTKNEMPATWFTKVIGETVVGWGGTKDTEVQYNTTYYYWVVAQSADTTYASSVPTKTQITLGSEPLPLPPAPEVTVTVTDKIRLSWESVGDVHGYYIYRGTDASSRPKFHYKDISAVGEVPDVFEFVDEEAVEGATYYYWVVAYRGATEGNFAGPFEASLPSTTGKPDLTFRSGAGWAKPLFLSTVQNAEGGCEWATEIKSTDTVYFNVAVWNAGTADCTTPFTTVIAVYDSKEKYVTGFEFTNTESYQTLTAGGNGYRWRNHDWSGLAGLPPGTYTLTCEIDSAHAVAESNEGNNFASFVFTVVEEGKPNLAFVRFYDQWPSAAFLSTSPHINDTSASTFAEGDTIYLFFGYWNNGAVRTTTAHTLLHEIINATTGKCIGDPLKVTDKWTDGFRVEYGGYEDGIAAPLLQNLPAGSYKYRITLDPDDEIDELDEGDNVVEIPFTVTGMPQPEQYKLTVASAHGSPSPTVGNHNYDAGTKVSASVASPDVAASGVTRYVCTGWTGTGSVPVSGGQAEVEFALNADSSLTWNWRTEYKLTIDTPVNGTITGASTGWYQDGTSKTLTASSSSGYEFVCWTGDTDGCTMNGNTISVPMSKPRQIGATFAKEQSVELVPVDYAQVSGIGGEYLAPGWAMLYEVQYANPAGADAVRTLVVTSRFSESFDLSAFEFDSVFVNGSRVLGVEANTPNPVDLYINGVFVKLGWQVDADAGVVEWTFESQNAFLSAGDAIKVEYFAQVRNNVSVVGKEARVGATFVANGGNPVCPLADCVYDIVGETEPPENFAAQAVIGQSGLYDHVRLSWNAVADTQYAICRVNPDGSAPWLAENVRAGSYDDYDVLGGMTYRYVLTAVGDGMVQSDDVYAPVTVPISLLTPENVVYAKAEENQYGPQVMANRAWKAESKDGWIAIQTEFSPEIDQIATEFKFTCEANTDTSPRTGTIYVIAGSVTNTISVIQDAAEEEVPDPNKPNLRFAKGNSSWPSEFFLAKSPDSATWPATSFSRSDSVLCYWGYELNGWENIQVESFMVLREIVDPATDEVLYADEPEEHETIGSSGYSSGGDPFVKECIKALPAGAYVYRMTLDSEDAIDEGSESDNVKEFAFTVEDVTDPVSRPENDDYAYAKVISDTSGSDGGTTENATTERNESAISAGGTVSNTIWWKWTAPAAGTLELDFSASAITPVFEVYTTGGGGGLSPVGLGFGTLVLSVLDGTTSGSLTVIKGYTYMIRVAGYANAAGKVRFSWFLPTGDGIWYVNGATGSDANDGTSPSKAKKTIQAAVNLASEDEEVLVADGVYAPFSAASVNGVTIRGEHGAAATVIDGGGNGTCANLGDLCGQSSISVLGTHRNTLVGFTVRNGAATNGGGVSGGYAENCIISNNTATGNGGGAYGCSLENCLVAGNVAGSKGGGVYEGYLDNCTVVENHAASYAGIKVLSTSGYTCRNSIIWNNTITGSSTVANHDDSNWRSMDFCCSTPGNGIFTYGLGGKSIAVDPKLNMTSGLYEPMVGSPCIDAGNNSYVSGETDLQGNARIVNGTVDIGAVEWQGGTVEPAQVATPVITPANGSTFSGDSCTVTITCATEGATIYYSTNGSSPRMNDQFKYTQPFTITDTTTVKAIAVKDGSTQSEIATAVITKINVETGKWNYDYASAKAFAEENDLPLVVFWTNPGCSHCATMIKAFETQKFLDWQDDREYVFVYSEGDMAVRDLVKNDSGLYPYVAVQWPSQDIDVRFTARDGLMPVTEGDLVDQFTQSVDLSLFGVVLSVESDYGSPEPSVGDHLYMAGSVVTAAVDFVVNEPGGQTRHVCLAGTGTGSAPERILTSVGAVFEITEDSSIVWNWLTQNMLTILEPENGTIGGAESGWFLEDETKTLTATPAGGYKFDGWTGDTDGCTIDGSTITVPMSKPRQIGATFVLDVQEQVATPVITPADGSTFDTDSCTVEITCATPGATIYYSTNGSTPRLKDQFKYTQPFTVTETTTIKAVAVKDGFTQSEIATATITKVAPPPLTLASALDEPKLSAVNTDGDAEWEPVKDVTAVGGSSARSGEIGMLQRTCLKATVYGKGTLSFNWKVSCEDDYSGLYTYDHLTLSTVEGGRTNDIAKIDGETEWLPESVTFTTDGPHVILWIYSTDDWEEPGFEDCGWVDNVAWSGDSPSSDIVISDVVTLPKAEVEAFMAKYPSLAAQVGGDAEAFAKLPSATGKLDANGNQMYVWQDIIAGTDPTNPDDKFKIVDIKFEDGELKVTWSPDMKDARKYTEFGRKELGGTEAWTDMKDVDPAEKNDYKFRKVMVDMP